MYITSEFVTQEKYIEASKIKDNIRLQQRFQRLTELFQRKGCASEGKLKILQFWNRMCCHKGKQHQMIRLYILFSAKPSSKLEHSRASYMSSFSF